MLLKGDYVKVKYPEYGIVVPGIIKEVKGKGVYKVRLFVCEMSDNRRFEHDCDVTADLITECAVNVVSERAKA